MDNFSNKRFEAEEEDYYFIYDTKTKNMIAKVPNLEKLVAVSDHDLIIVCGYDKVENKEGQKCLLHLYVNNSFVKLRHRFDNIDSYDCSKDQKVWTIHEEDDCWSALYDIETGKQLYTKLLAPAKAKNKKFDVSNKDYITMTYEVTIGSFSDIITTTLDYDNFDTISTHSRNWVEEIRCPSRFDSCDESKYGKWYRNHIERNYIKLLKMEEELYEATQRFSSVSHSSFLNSLNEVFEKRSEKKRLEEEEEALEMHIQKLDDLDTTIENEEAGLILTKKKQGSR